MEQKFKAEIVTISDVVKTKKGNGKQYLTCTVKFTEGPISGQTWFAQRTLGENKSAIKVGQAVTAHMSVVDGQPFFELSTGSTVSDRDTFLGLLGL